MINKIKISKDKIICKRIENSQGKNDGYIVQSGKQMIVMLPDIPDELNTMMGNVLLQYIAECYSLKFTKTADSTEKQISFKNYDNFDTFFENVQKNTIYDYSPKVHRSRKLDKFLYYIIKGARAILISLGIVLASVVIVYLVIRYGIYG